MSDINEEKEPLNTDEQPTTTDNESVNKDNEIINKINKINKINLNNESPPKQTKPKRKIIPPTRPKRDPLPKVRLTTAERNKIIYDYERGVDNPIWEVVITKTNKKIVRRKKDPEANFSEISGLIKSEPKREPEPKISREPEANNSPPTNSDKSWLSSIQYYNVQNSFNEQLLKQLDELNNKINHQNNKHKKLKTKYKKLKRSLYSDDSDNETHPEENVNNEPVISVPEYEYEPQQMSQPIRRKLNLRDAIDFTKYGFSPL